MDIGTIAVGAGLGMISDIANQDRSNQNFSQQMAGAKELALFNKKQQLDIFQKTGYDAQVKQMIEAGLNPALMYKGAGAGGQTNLATQDIKKDFTESKALEGMEIATALESNQANIELMKSQARKNDAEATKISGVDTTETEQRIENLISGKEGQEIQNELNGITLRVQKQAETEGIQYENLKAEMITINAQMQKAVNDGYISNTTREDTIELIRQDVINAGLQGELTKANIKYTEEETKAISRRLAQIDKNLTYEERKTAVQEAFKDFGTGTAAEIERAVRIGGNVVNTVTDVIPQTRGLKKLETITNYDKHGNYNGEQNRSTEYRR